MKPEPKSIFTSQKDFGIQPTSDRATPPQLLTKNNVPPSPIRIEDPTDREAEVRKILVEASTTAGNRETITIRSRENSREDSKDLDTSADHNKSFNAPQKRSLSSPSLEPPSFRKPELPASHAQFRTAPKTAHAAKHPRSEDKRRPVSTERAPKRTRPKLTSRHTLDPESFHTAGAAAPRKFISPPLAFILLAYSTASTFSLSRLLKLRSRCYNVEQGSR